MGSPGEERDANRDFIVRARRLTLAAFDWQNEGFRAVHVHPRGGESPRRGGAALPVPGQREASKAGEVDGTSGGVRISAASDDGPGDSPPGDSREFVAFAPLPYRVPPVPYAPSDAPWAVDAWDETPDKYGRVMRGGIADRFDAR